MPHTTYKDWPSVTEVVSVLSKPFLAFWRGKIGNQEADRVMKEAQEEGIKLHNAVEQYLKNNTLEKETSRFFAWFKWWESKVEYLQTKVEIKVISKKYKYHGTFDALIEDSESNLILTDWKFSNSDDHFRYLQLAGYAQAYYEQTKVKIQRGMIVRVDKEAKVHVTEIEDLWKFVPYFIMVRKLWDFVNNKGRFKKESKATVAQRQ